MYPYIRPDWTVIHVKPDAVNCTETKNQSFIPLPCNQAKHIFAPNVYIIRLVNDIRVELNLLPVASPVHSNTSSLRMAVYRTLMTPPLAQPFCISSELQVVIPVI